MEAARDLVGVVVELPARVEVRHDDLERLALVLLVEPDGDAAAVVLDGDGVVGVDRDPDVVRVADLGLVDRVVDELEDHVVEAREIVGVPDVHAGALADGLEALQQLDGVGGVGRAHGAPSFTLRPREERGSAQRLSGRTRAPPRISRTAAAFRRSDQRPARRRRRQQDLRLRGQRVEELFDPALRKSGVEIVGGEQRRLPGRSGDGAPLRELDERDGARDLSGGGLRGQRTALPRPEQIVAVRAGERIPPPALEGQAAAGRRPAAPRPSRRRPNTPRGPRGTPRRPRAREARILRSRGPSAARRWRRTPLRPPRALPSRLRARPARRVPPPCAAGTREQGVALPQRRAVARRGRLPPRASGRARAGRETGAAPTGAPSRSSRCSGARKTAGARAETSRNPAVFSPRRNSRPADARPGDGEAIRPAPEPAASTTPVIEKASPSRAMAADVAPRNERCPHTRAAASRRFVLPCAFSPVMSVTPAPKNTGSEERLRKPWFEISESCKRSCPTSRVQRRIGMTT